MGKEEPSKAAADVAALRGGYAQSKAVGEVLVASALADGCIPHASIYRAGIVGPSECGHANPSDVVQRTLNVGMRLGGILPFFDPATTLDYSPADWVAATIVELLTRAAADAEEAVARVFHCLSPRHEMPASALHDALALCGQTKIRTLPREAWLDKLRQAHTAAAQGREVGQLLAIAHELRSGGRPSNRVLERAKVLETLPPDVRATLPPEAVSAERLARGVQAVWCGDAATVEAPASSAPSLEIQ